MERISRILSTKKEICLGHFNSIVANWCQVEHNFSKNKSKIRAKRKYNRICFPYFDDVFLIALWRVFNGFDFIWLSQVAVCQTILVIYDVPHLTFYKSLNVRAVIVNNSLTFWMVTYRGLSRYKEAWNELENRGQTRNWIYFDSTIKKRNYLL